MQIADALHNLSQHVVLGRIDFGRVRVNVVTCIVGVNEHVQRCCRAGGEYVGHLVIVSVNGGGTVAFVNEPSECG